MMITETEAKTKDCPFRGLFKTMYTCDGSKCMAWRWSKKLTKDEEVYTNAARENGLSYVRSGKGFCGLVGRPEEESQA